MSDEESSGAALMVILFGIFAGFLALAAIFSAIDARDKRALEAAHKQKLLDSCVDTGKPLYKCEIELKEHRKFNFSFDHNLVFQKKD